MDEKSRIEHAILGRLEDNKATLRISRIPSTTVQEFIKLAEKDFCGDYGFTLKWLVDGIPSQEFDILSQEIALLESRLTNIEQLLSNQNKPISEKEETTRKMVDGSVKNVKRDA